MLSMPVLRLLPVVLIVLALFATPASAQAPTIPLPGGGQIKVKLPTPKGKKHKPARPIRTRTVQVGIADEKAGMFSDPRFLALGMRTARRSVAWDVFKHDWALAEVDEWLAHARAAGVRPLITFGRSRIQSQFHYIPTRAEYRDMFRKFRARWPWVTDFVATNESNYSDPGFKRPELAARYYNDMRKACRHCKVAAATLLEVPKREKYMRRWVKRFLRVARPRPKYWAIHNYFSANQLSLKGTRRMLKLTKRGEIWVTEVGGLVKRRSNFVGKVPMREGPTHAKRVTRYIFDRIIPSSSRIKRVYLFHWNAAGPTDTWDSGLVAPDGTARGTLDIVRSKLGRLPR